MEFEIERPNKEGGTARQVGQLAQILLLFNFPFLWIRALESRGNFQISKGKKCNLSSSEASGFPHSSLGRATSPGPRVPSCSAQCMPAHLEGPHLGSLIEMRRLVVRAKASGKFSSRKCY